MRYDKGEPGDFQPQPASLRSFPSGSPTITDEYSPETKKEPFAKGTNNATLTQLTSSIGKGETNLQGILNAFKVECEYPPYSRMPIYNAYHKGRPMFTYPDSFVHDIRFGWGVFLVDGSIHQTTGNRKKDERQDEEYERLGVWVERLSPTEAKDPEIVAERL